MKKYRTSNGDGFKLIQVIECERETEKSVWIKGQRFVKVSSFRVYHDTFDDAKDFLLQAISEDIKKANNKACSIFNPSYMKRAEKQLLSVTMWEKGKDNYYA